MKIENLIEFDDLSINTLLAKLNFRPMTQTQNETVYANILTVNNNKSIFKVNNNLNCWYDSHSGKGGNLTAFAKLFWAGLTTEQINIQLSNIISSTSSLQQPSVPRKKRTRKLIKLPCYKIHSIMPLGNHYGLREFLEQEGIWQFTDMYLKEIQYYSVNAKGLRKNFRAVGWQNENGGWELKARTFRDCIGTRGMTFHERSSNVLLIFSDYPDYLKAQIHNDIPHASILIINHRIFMEEAKIRAKCYEKVISFAN